MINRITNKSKRSLLILVPAFLLILVESNLGAQDLEVIALRSQTAPGTKSTFFVLCCEVELDFDGDVTFHSIVTGDDEGSMFQQQNGALFPLVLHADPFPGLAFALDGVRSFDKNSLDEFVIGTNVNPTFLSDLLVRRNAANEFEVLVQPGQLLPGSPMGYLFSGLDFNHPPIIAENGVVGMAARIVNAGSILDGIWADRNDGNGVVPILVEGLENGDPQNLTDYDMNNNGIFAIESQVVGDSTNRIFSDRGSAMANPIYVFQNILEVEMNDQNRIALMNINEFGDWEVLSEGFTGTMNVIATQGDPAVGLNDVVFGEFQTSNSGSVSRCLELNNQDQSVFFSMLEGVNVTEENDEAVWKHSSLGNIEFVVRKGDPAPGTSMVFGNLAGTTFSTAKLNDRGQVVLIAGVNDGVDDLLGIWVQDTQGQLQLVIHEGQQVDVDPGPGVDLRVVGFLNFLQDLEINNRGQIAFVSGLPANSRAIFLSNVALEIIIGDTNGDGNVNLLDVQPFIDRLASGVYLEEADVNQDGLVNLLDVQPFIMLLSGG